MDDGLSRFREAADRENAERPVRRRYSPTLQREAVAYWQHRRGQEGMRAVAALGVSMTTLQRWTRGADAAAMRWHGRRMAVYAYTQPVDMRKGFDGLSALVTGRGGPEDVIDCPCQLVDSGVAYVGSSEIGYSHRVRGLRGAGSRSALPLRFSVSFECGG